MTTPFIKSNKQIYSNSFNVTLMVSKNRASNVKYLLIIIYVIEFIYIIVMPHLIALYIFINTIIQGFILVYLLRDKQVIEIKTK